MRDEHELIQLFVDTEKFCTKTFSSDDSRKMIEEQITLVHAQIRVCFAQLRNSTSHSGAMFSDVGQCCAVQWEFQCLLFR